MSNYRIHLDINYELIEVEATPNYTNKNRLLVDSVSGQDYIQKNFHKEISGVFENIIPIDVCNISLDKLFIDELSIEDSYINVFTKISSDNVSFLDIVELENIKVNIEELPFTDICSKDFTKNIISEAVIWDNVEILIEEIESLTLNSYQLNLQQLN